MDEKTVTILADSNGFMSATNSKSRNVWVETAPGTYTYSHTVENQPTHTLKEITETLALSEAGEL